MFMKKILMLVALIGLSAMLSAQSLVELAKLEKARRESLKGRHAVVIRNRDLLAVRKLPAVEVTGPGEAEAAEEEAAGTDAGLEATTGEGTHIVPHVEADGPSFSSPAGSRAPSTKALEAQLQAATEQVDLLTTKMAALRQQLESQDAMVPGYVIQQQLDETSQRLLKAQAQLARIQADLNKMRTGQRAALDIDR
jgi:hypothetical protein